MNGELCPISGLERLVLATDGSEFSEGAIRESIGIARACSSRLYAISVIQVNPEIEVLIPELIEKAERETRDHLERIRASAAKEGVDCEIIVHQDEQPYRYIVEEASEKRADVIIMGRRRKTGLKRLMIGSVTAAVIGHAGCNVLVVPRDARIEFKNILAAIDGSRYSDAVASEAIKIATRSKGNLFILYAASGDADMKESEENLNKVKRMAEGEGVGVEAICEKGKPHEVIVNKAKEKNADLIVMGSHGRTGLKRLLIGSVTERVIGHADCAVLVVREKQN